MSNTEGDLLISRRVKLERLRERGIDPFPHRYNRTHTLEEAAALFQDTGQDPDKEEDGTHKPKISLAGRIISIRNMGKATFLHMQDESGTIQVHLRRDILEEVYETVRDLDIGDFLGVKGPLFQTRTGEITLEAHESVLLSKAMRPLPEKWHGLNDVETRYRQRYLDLISSPQARANFRIRSLMISSIRRYLDARGFMEVETPILVPIAAGAMAKPFITHFNALDRDLYLRIATELYLKRLIIGGMDKVYEIGRVFRNEGIDLDHNPEFTLLESYEAYSDYNDVMNMVEEMIFSVAQEAIGTAKVEFGDHIIDFTPPWKRLSLREEVIKRTGIDFQEYTDPDVLASKMKSLGIETEDHSSRGRLIDKLVSSLVEPHLIQPTFLLDYPLDMSPLAKQKETDPSLVERFEAFVGGFEIANSFTELNDPDEQRQRFLQQENLRSQLGEEVDRLDEDFLLALEHGMPPTGGLGIGLDRLSMLMTGQQSIREVILFPQMRDRQ